MNIRLSLSPPIAVITLNRPEVRNALSPELIRDFQVALDEIEGRPDIAVVIVTGEGTAFSAGADLQSLRAMTSQPAEQSRQDSLALMHLFKRIYEFPQPVIAAVNGAAMGGGCGLASVCDLVIAAENAPFGYTELRVGFVPALVSVFLIRICGDKKARELLYTGRRFSAGEALDLGLVNHVVPAGRLLEKAQAVALEIAGSSPSGLQLTKQLLRDMHGLTLDAALSAAVQVNALVRQSDDFREGVSAFLEKRRPRWQR